MDEEFENVRDFKTEIETFKAENENLKRDYEKITIDYELKIDNLKKEINLKTVNYENLMINFQELDAKYKNSCQEKISVNQNYFDLSQEKFNIVKKYDNLESEHATLLELISRREKEQLNYKNEIQELQVQLTKYKNKEIDSKLSMNELEFRQKDFEQMEHLSVLRNKKFIDEIQALEEKIAESMKTNHEEQTIHNKVVYDLNLELDSKRNEIKNFKKTIEKLKEQICHLEKVNLEKNESLRSTVESQTNIDNLLRKEINVQQSINELMREKAEESEIKERNLINAIKELQESLKETFEESEKMKSEFEVKLTEYDQQVLELRKEIVNKEKELNDANELFEKFRVKSLSEDEIKSMNPATAAAISALKRGYSMTQIYSEYLQVVNEKEELRVDRDRLNEYMMSILEELEQKAPLLKKQQEEHSYLELSVSTLAKKYDDNLSELFTCQSDLEESHKKNEDLTNKLKREEQTCSDLSQQVCCLLREIETFRGTVIRSDNWINNADEPEFIRRRRSLHQRSLLHNSHSSLNMSNVTSVEPANKFITANDIITTHLVTFKNICELQQKNIQLLEQFRDLSEQQETTENMINENSMQDLAKKLEQAYKDMNDINEKQKQNKQLMKTVNAQKHIIQALTMVHSKSDLTSLIESGVFNIDTIDENAHSLSTMQDGSGDKRNNQANLNAISILNEKIAEHQEKIDKLHFENENLRNEKELLKEKHSNIITELHQSLSEVKIANANLMAKISFNQEKSSSLEQNLINRQLEMTDLQNDLSEANQKLAQKSEESVSLSNQLKTCQMRLKEQETESKHLEFNRRHIESLEEQLNSEKSEKYQLMSSINEMASQISNIQTHINKSQLDPSTEDQIELKSRIKQLALELKQEKSKYQSSLEMWQAKFSESSTIIDTLKSQLSNENRTSSSASLTISDSCTIGILQTAPEKIEKTGDLESQLEDLAVSNYSLKKQIESYQDLMTNSESKLISNAQLIVEMEMKFQNKIIELTQEKAETEGLLESFQLANRELEADFNNKEKSLEDQIRELERSLENKTNLIDSLNGELSILKDKECQLKLDLERQRQITKTATENYQQELIYHAQESEALEELNKQMNQIKNQERNLTEKLQETILLRDQYKSDLDNRDNIWSAEKAVSEKEISDLKSQKDFLNNRLIDLNDQLVNLKKLLDPSMMNSIDYAVIQRENDWNEVIQYLRQEKENVERIKNQLEIDFNRLKVQSRQQEEKIDQLNKTLEEERRFRVVEAETQKQHSEIMLEMESKQMLMESNAKLRLDRETIKDRLTETSKKLEQIKESIEPLKAELKSKSNEIENVKLDARSLENERDLWRRRCDNLIEKSKQINPEEFKQMCIEKDKLQHQLLLEEEKCRVNIANVEELRIQIDEYVKSLKDKEDQLESMKKIIDDNQAVIQKRESMIVQLKDIGRKYKTETESLSSEIVKVTDQKEDKCKEIQTLKKELVETKVLLDESRREFQQHLSQANTSSNSVSLANDEFIKKLSSILQCPTNPNDIIDSSDKLFKDNQNNMQLLETGDSELKLRIQAIEGHLTKVKLENERLKKQLEVRSSLNSQDDDNGTSEDNSTEVLPTNSVFQHAVPTVARVAANVHPVVQKPQNIMPGSNQISPNSQPISTCTSTARQTAEIRPIPAVALHIAPSNSAAESSDSVSTASVTTSLPASVVQALAASSVPTVIFPAVSGFSSSSAVTSSTSNINRLKRCFEDTIEPESRSLFEEPSSSADNVVIKKIRIRVSEPTVAPVIQEVISQDSHIQEFLHPVTEFCPLENVDEVCCEEEIEIESEDIEDIEITEDDEDENKSKNDLDESVTELIDDSRNLNNFSDVDNSVEEEDYEEEECCEEDENEESDENEHDDDNEEEEDDDDDNDNDNDNDDDDDDDDDEDDNNIDDNVNDDDDDDEEDENPDVIDLLSSDDNNDGNDNTDNNDNIEDNNPESSNFKDDKNESVSEEFRSAESELEQAKKKIEPIVWTDYNQRKNNLLANRKENFLTSPTKLGQPIKTRYSGNIGFRRKLTTSRRNFSFVTSGGRGMSVGRRSGGPFKGRFTPR